MSRWPGSSLAHRRTRRSAPRNHGLSVSCREAEQLARYIPVQVSGSDTAASFAERVAAAESQLGKESATASATEQRIFLRKQKNWPGAEPCPLSLSLHGLNFFFFLLAL